MKFSCNFATTGINEDFTLGFLLISLDSQLGRGLDVCLLAKMEVNTSLIEIILSEMLKDGTYSPISSMSTFFL